MQDRSKCDEDLRIHLEEIEYMMNFLSNNFELSVENIDNLIVETDNNLSFFAINTGDLQPKQYILYPPHDYSLVDLYQRKYPTFYDVLKYYMLYLCRNRGFKPSDETLKFLMYSLILKWKDITKYLFQRYNAITLKVYSHLSIRHAEALAESLISDLPEAIEVSVLKEPFLNEEILSKYDFDILVSAETLFLNIKQPIVYMYKSRSSYQYGHLHKLINEKAAHREKVMRDKFMKKYQDVISRYNVPIEQTK